MLDNDLHLAEQLAERFAALPQVEAVALGGSRGSPAGAPDATSDIDVYVYTRADIPRETRQSIVEQSGGATKSSLGLNYWGPGDEWMHAPTGIEVDMVYFDTRWMEEQIQRVIDLQQASLGYSTCFLYTIRHSKILSDSQGWYAALQAKCNIDYPEQLRQNIVQLNHPVLRGIIPAYANQLEKAAKRRDLVSVNHRLAALLASYFDILFAVNRQLHPGEKRLVELAVKRCDRLPDQMQAEVSAVLQAAALEGLPLLDCVTKLLDHLDQLLEAEGFDLRSG